MKTCPSCRAAYDDNIDFCPRDGATLRPMAGLEPGTILRKKYQIVSEIARGGMGVVYRARHLLWNEEKAIKLLLDMHADREQQCKGFLSEALVMRQLQHPNIVRVEDADFTEDDKLFVVMEYVDGESLHHRMDRRVLPWEQALDFTAQACAGLAAAHQKGIIHRDIKPQNLLLAKDAGGREVVKLIDFGIARVREEAGLGFTGVVNTTAGSFVGTPEYASPEQARGMRGNELDGRTDIYSLGLVLFEMLTGERPFQADTMVAALMMRLLNDPVSPRELRPELNIPRRVSDVVMKAIAKERQDRYGSAEEMQRAIEGVLRAPETQKPAPETPQPKTKPGRRVLAGSVAGIGALALAGWLFLLRPHPRSPAAPPTPAVITTPPATPTGKPAELPVRKKAEAAPAKPIASVTPTPAALKAGQTKVNAQDGLKYIWIAPGKFLLGCSPADTDCNDDEKPAHEVTLPSGFWMGETEVTQAAYEHLIGNNPSSFKGANLPVDTVSWFQANAYCKAAGMRLPTDAEWEYAARGGNNGLRYGNPGVIAWWTGNSQEKTHDVRQKQPNGFGLYDILGNVAEWTSDWYAPYTAAAAVDPHGPTEGEYHTIRGGSWLAGVNIIRVSSRVARKPVFHRSNIGFRCAGN